MTELALILAVIFFILGLAGIVLPVLPGIILIYVGMLIYGFMTQFATLDANFFLLQGLVVLLASGLDFVATAVGTKRFGGSKNAVWGSVIGILIGLLLFGPFGIILGSFLGAVIAEILQGKNMNIAIRSGFGTLIGIVGATALKIIIGVLMIIAFFLSRAS
ncbi:MAG: DUF456 domain-containing protein [Firmicutes bacterium]|jgi:uncharacterized protein YqgC (DUF456 family)|nr:DUF456 domain-containing protein [Dethiobacter sp.]MCL4464129.1 DUF456 domain-containing protein [Bacillota bacterium]MCL5993756.1 DUF456 domain-containing protein [Bacillota bacterium]